MRKLTRTLTLTLIPAVILPLLAFEVHNASNVPGIKKWSTNAEKCFSYWTKINTDCRPKPSHTELKP